MDNADKNYDPNEKPNTNIQDYKLIKKYGTDIDLIEDLLQELKNLGIGNEKKLKRFGMFNVQEEPKWNLIQDRAIKSEIKKINLIEREAHFMKSILNRLQTNSPVSAFIPQITPQQKTKFRQDLGKKFSLQDAIDLISQGEIGTELKLPKLFWPESTKSILNEIEDLLEKTNTKKLSGNSSCRLLLGSKGIGKTTLLQIITYVTALLYDNIIPIYVNYKLIKNFLKEFPDSSNPSHLIWHALNICRPDLDFKYPQNIATCVTELRKIDIQVVIFSDEIHEVFQQNPGACMKIICEYFAIGETKNGTIWSIISGSAAVTRDLCYKTLPKELWQDYPGYPCVSLNHSRYTIMQIKPIQTKEEFQKLLVHVLNDDRYFFSKSKDIEKLLKTALTDDGHPITEYLYLASGGVFRELNDVLSGDHVLQISRKIKDYVDFRSDKNAQKILEYFFEQWNLNIWDLPSINIIDLKEKQISTKYLYGLSDNGVLNLTQNHWYSTFTFSIPVYLLCFKNGGNYLSLYEKFCLQYPIQSLELK